MTDQLVYKGKLRAVPSPPILGSPSVTPVTKRKMYKQSSLVEIDHGVEIAAGATPALEVAQPTRREKTLVVGGDSDSDGDNKDDAKDRKPLWLEWKIRHHYQATIAKIPPKYKYLFFFFWVAWKVVAAYLLYYVVRPASNNKLPSSSSALVWVPSILPEQENTKRDIDKSPVRVLYIVTTTIDESNAADASLFQTLPLLRHNVASILQEGYHVDLVWIQNTGNELKDGAEQRMLLQMQRMARKAFPSQVGLSFWPRANPWVLDHQTGRLTLEHQHPSEQAWWVIRDRFSLYHVFMVWPDTVRFLGPHVHHFWTLSQQLLLLQRENPLLEKLVPALLPATVLPRGHWNQVDNHNSTITITSRKLGHMSLQDHDQFLESNPELLLPLHSLLQLSSWNGSLTLGPALRMPQTYSNQTNNISSRSNPEPTVVIPAAALSQSPGFIVSRSQLAQHGLFECLFPTALPIAWPSLSTKGENMDYGPPVRQLCRPPGPGLLLANNVSQHVVQFLWQTHPSHNSPQRRQEREQEDANHVLSLGMLLQNVGAVTKQTESRQSSQDKRQP